MSIPSYPKYNDSGVEWLGMIPMHWGNASLRWLSTRYTGGTPDKQNLDYWLKGSVPWINSGAVNQSLITEPSEYITEEAFENSSAKWIPSGALVMAIAGQGKTKGMVAQLAITTTGNQSLAAIIPNRKLETRFLYWWLTYNYQRVRNMAGGDLRDGLNLELLGNIPCPLPSNDEQSVIATFLDHETEKIDALVAEQEMLITLLIEKRKAVISHTVIKGLNPSVPMKDSGIEWLGEVPEHWDVKPLKYCLDKNGLVRGPFGGDLKKELFVDNGVKVYEQKNAIYQDYLIGDSYVSDTKCKEMSRFLVFPGDFIMSCSGTIGRVYRIPEGAPLGIINQALLIIRFDTLIDSDYGYRIFTSDFFQLQIIDNSQGGAMKNLVGMDRFTLVSLPVPPIPEQSAIADFLDRETAKVDELLTEAQRAIELLKERRNALISAAVTGKIDVRRLVLEEVTI